MRDQSGENDGGQAMSGIVPRLLAVIALLGALAAVPSAGAAGNGIRGRATSSPTCPVERMPPDPGCAPRGFAARVRVYRLTDNRTIKRLTTRDDGRFSVRLRPGGYGLTARAVSGASLPRCNGPVKATVRAGHYTRVAIDCDSGIR
jgi:hypothetical protein